MTSSTEANAISMEDVYAVLSNPIKRRIIEVIAEKRAASFTDLKRDLNISVGALYYNLDGLKDYITKDDNRKYVLTQKGVVLYRALKEGDEAIKNALAPRAGIVRFVEEKLLPYLVPQQLMIPLYRNNALSIAIAIGCMMVGLATTLLTRLPLKILEVEQVPALLPAKRIGPFVLRPEILLLIDYSLSYVITALIAHITAHAISGNEPPILGLAAGLALAQVPLHFYMFVQWALTGWSYPEVAEHTMVLLGIVLRLLQLLCMGLLTAAISVFYRLRRERSFLIAVLLAYVSFALKNFLP